MNIVQLNTVNLGGDIVIKKSEGGSESGGNGGGDNGDWAYYQGIPLPADESMESLILMWGVRAEFKQLIGNYTAPHEWWFTARGSLADLMTVVDSGQDDYKGSYQMALDLSQRVRTTRGSGLIDLSYRDLIYGDETHPDWELIQGAREWNPLYNMIKALPQITKEEWDRDDYTGVILGTETTE